MGMYGPFSPLFAPRPPATPTASKRSPGRPRSVQAPSFERPARTGNGAASSIEPGTKPCVYGGPWRRRGAALEACRRPRDAAPRLDLLQTATFVATCNSRDPRGRLRRWRGPRRSREPGDDFAGGSPAVFGLRIARAAVARKLLLPDDEPRLAARRRSMDRNDWLRVRSSNPSLHTEPDSNGTPWRARRRAPLHRANFLASAVSPDRATRRLEEGTSRAKHCPNAKRPRFLRGSSRVAGKPRASYRAASASAQRRQPARRTTSCSNLRNAARRPADGIYGKHEPDAPRT